MEWTSIIAIYALIWVASAFLMLPFGVQTDDELGLKKIAGQADSAPANFHPQSIVRRATWIAALLTLLYVANYTNGWIQVETLNLFEPPSDIQTTLEN